MILITSPVQLSLYTLARIPEPLRVAQLRVQFAHARLVGRAHRDEKASRNNHRLIGKTRYQVSVALKGLPLQGTERVEHLQQFLLWRSCIVLE